MALNEDQKERYFSVQLLGMKMTFYMIPVIAVFCMGVICFHSYFPEKVVTGAEVALLVDILGAFVGTYTLVVRRIGK